MATNWNNEIRRRLRGCPRQARTALKPERDRLRALYQPGQHAENIASISVACGDFDRKLRDLGYELLPSGSLT